MIPQEGMRDTRKVKKMAILVAQDFEERGKDMRRPRFLYGLSDGSPQTTKESSLRPSDKVSMKHCFEKFAHWGATTVGEKKGGNASALGRKVHT